jgi:orotate phosphoribosyltransferase
MFQNPLEILERVGAVVRNTHAVGTTGIHLDTYVEIRVLRKYAQETAILCRSLAALADDVDALIGPAGGGDFIVREVALQLSTILGRKVAVILAEKAPDGAFRVDETLHHLVQGQRVLVVDDVLNTGATLQRIVALTRELGGIVMGAGVVCSHGIMDDEALGVPWLHALATVQSRRWSLEECRLRGLCKEGVPVNPNLGHGAEFLASKASQ